MAACVRLITCCALLAAASASAAGINLTWNSCAGPSVRTFACNTNAGAACLFGSFVAPPGMSALAGNEIVLDLQAASATPVCLSLQSIKLLRPAGVGDVLLNTPAFSTCALWEAGIHCCQVPARNRTWGAVKALYR